MAKKKKELNTTEYIFKKGDNITTVAEKITGRNYLLFKLLQFNNLTMSEVKEGTVLKWR